MRKYQFMDFYCYEYNKEHYEIIIDSLFQIFIERIQHGIEYKNIDIDALIDSFNFNIYLKELVLIGIILDSNGDSQTYNTLILDVELNKRLNLNSNLTEDDISELIFVRKLLDSMRLYDVDSFLELIHKFCSYEKYYEILNKFKNIGDKGKITTDFFAILENMKKPFGERP